MKPTVGRIVHFFTSDTTKHFNGSGEGPYPAIVTQNFDSGEYVNLKVLHYGGMYDEGSVSEKSESNTSRYWVWPPRETPAAAVVEPAAVEAEHNDTVEQA